MLKQSQVLLEELEGWVWRVITGHGGFEMVLEGIQLARNANCLGTDQASANFSVVTGCEEKKREHIKEINFPNLRIYS